jgi:hypothetical protein
MSVSGFGDFFMSIAKRWLWWPVWVWTKKKNGWPWWVWTKKKNRRRKKRMKKKKKGVRLSEKNARTEITFFMIIIMLG